MNSALKSRNHIRAIVALWLILTFGATAFLAIPGSVWTPYDFKILDSLYARAVEHGVGPPKSDRIVLLPISDSTYKAFNKNVLDRKDLAGINDALSNLGIQAVAYDIIFAFPSNPESDDRFRDSIRRLGSVYLPTGLQYSLTMQAFRREEGAGYDRLLSEYLCKPLERGHPHPYYATKGLLQYAAFAEAAFKSGHISDYSDPDGYHRHMIMLLKVNDRYFPALSLAMFLDYAGVPFDRVTVDWGHRLVIPAIKGSLLGGDVVIPIDDHGRTFIPYAGTWNSSFKMMDAQRLLELAADENVRGNLMEFFEGRFIFIGDVSVGTSDLGHSPLEQNVPLMITHASVLNGMLTNTFYEKSSIRQVIGILWLMSIILGISALFRFWWIQSSTALVLMASLIYFTWLQLTHHALFPLFTAGASFVFIFTGLIGAQGALVIRERKLIKTAFSKYVPRRVVDQLLEKPELLRLGGEERVATVLFTDIVDFTGIAEKRTPTELVLQLNEYLTEMTRIVFSHGGIIDKYIGDTIMAEYGVPIPTPDHADMALKTALEMQDRLKQLRPLWEKRGLPELKCRIGINTGPMIVGNMGSHEILDYTVIGDAVNLASRLEGVNRYYGTGILISEFTRQCLTPGLFRTRIIDVIKVKGKSVAVRVYEVYGDASSALDSADEAYYRAYQEAFEAYLGRNFVAALEKFDEALSLRPGDLASKTMLARIEEIKTSDLPSDWDGSFLYHVK